MATLTAAGTNRPHRAIREWLVVTVIVSVLAGVASWYGWFWRADLALYDSALSARPHSPDSDVLIVAIDDASLARLGRWPWSRDVHAALVDRLRDAGVRAIAFDVLFPESSPQDLNLADAIRRHGHVVLPIGQVDNGSGGLTEAPPVPELANAAAALGHVQIEFDQDGIARSVYRLEGAGAARIPLLADALRMTAEGVRVPPPGSPPSGDGTWYRSGWLRFPFLGPPGTVPQVSYADVLDGHVPASALENQVVLVGSTAAGLADAVPVPTSGFARPMPGVEVHAQLLSALRRHATVSLAGRAWDTFFAVALTMGLMALLTRLRAREGGVVTLAALALVLVCALGGAHLAGVWFNPSGSLLACTLAYPLWSWRRLEATQRYLDRELAGLGSAIEHPRTLATFDPLQERIAIVRAAAVKQRAARSFLAGTLEHLPIGVIVANDDGIIRLHNALAATLLASEDPRTLQNTLAELLGHNWASGPYRTPVEFSTAGGRRIRSTGAVIELPGERAGVVLALDDITDLRAAESLRDDALSFLSHDMRSPLASIIVLTDCMRQFQMPPEPDLIERIGRHAQTALERADSVLRLMQAGALDPTRFEDVDLVRLTYEAVDECWAQARARDIKLTVDLGPVTDEEALVHGDVDLLRRAIANLIGNAIKYGDAETETIIRIEDEGERWCVAVCDRGPGISADDLPRLFQRSVRLAPNRARGSGLGLAFVRTVAERHGGHATAQSEEGYGSVFRLSLQKQANPIAV